MGLPQAQSSTEEMSAAALPQMGGMPMGGMPMGGMPIATGSAVPVGQPMMGLPQTVQTPMQQMQMPMQPQTVRMVVPGPEQTFQEPVQVQTMQTVTEYQTVNES